DRDAGAGLGEVRVARGACVQGVRCGDLKRTGDGDRAAAGDVGRRVAVPANAAERHVRVVDILARAGDVFGDRAHDRGRGDRRRAGAGEGRVVDRHGGAGERDDQALRGWRARTVGARAGVRERRAGAGRDVLAVLTVAR